MNGKNTGTGGVIGLIIAAAALFAAGKFIPGAVKTILIVAGIVVAALIALIIVGIVLAARDDRKKAAQAGTGKDLTGDQRDILTKGRDQLMEIRRKIMRISTIPVRSKANEVCGVIDKIFQTLRDNPEKISSVRQFLNYYIPTLGKVLEKYDRLEDSHTVTPEITENVENYLADMKNAMNRLHDSLYESDKLDLSVEMEAMMLAVKRDGLIEDKDQILK